jgi:hypothetical protein
MLMEGLITLIIVGALLYVTPGTLGQVKQAAPVVNATVDPALNASMSTISTSVGGGVSLAGISPIMIGIGLMILGFTFIRSRGSQ